jgi:hypothetical protein
MSPQRRAGKKSTTSRGQSISPANLDIFGTSASVGKIVKKRKAKSADGSCLIQTVSGKALEG